MNIVQITPGAGGMYCGNCFRDNALVGALRQMGHQTLMVPLYLPMTLEEEDQSAGTRIFFGGISVYLEQKSSWFRKAPSWLRDVLSSPALLKWAAGRAAKTRAADVGDLTISMLQGEEGRQRRDLEELASWLKTQPPPDAICLSNALLIGLARELRRELNAPVVCMLQGEDSFLDALPGDQSTTAWQVLAERSVDCDLFVAPSRYFADLMIERLRLSPDKVRVVHNGVSVEQYESSEAPPAGQVIGFFARMCREKGLELLVEAFVLLKQRGRARQARLRVGGGLGPSDEAFVGGLKNRLKTAGLLGDVDFCPNLSKSEKIQFFRSLNVFSTPALYSEAFGLYVIEAMAAGVPVVQPSHAAFPELIEATGGGLLFPAGDAGALSEALEGLLLDPARARALGQSGQRAVRERLSTQAMALQMLKVFEEVANRQPQRAAV